MVLTRSHAPTGYRHPGYALSLEEFGTPIQLPRTGGWLLMRGIHGGDHRDAMGTYPLTVVGDWSLLRDDLAELPSDLVTATLVTDPFGTDLPAALHDAFDFARPFKSHYVMDLSVPASQHVTQHHQRQVRRSLEVYEVEPVPDPSRFVDEWVGLFAHTIRRHGLTGMKAFSRAAFEQQLRLPGVVMFRALDGDRAVAASTWMLDGDVADGHLVGISPSAYIVPASYALIWVAAEWFGGRCRWLDLGGTAGAGHDPSDGLAAFKSGWTRETRTTYLCGVVLDQLAYAEMTTDVPQGGYFPAYRYGELL